MNGDDSLNAAIEFAAGKTLLEIYGYQSCLPVVAVDQIGSEIKQRQCGKDCFAKVCISLNLISGIVVIYLGAAEIVLVVDEIVSDAVDFSLEEAYIDILPVIIHVEGADVLELILHLLLHAGILRQKNSYVKVSLVEILGERAYYIRKSACFDERHPLRCNEQNFLHRVCLRLCVFRLSVLYSLS